MGCQSRAQQACVQNLPKKHPKVTIEDVIDSDDDDFVPMIWIMSQTLNQKTDLIVKTRTQRMSALTAESPCLSLMSWMRMTGWTWRMSWMKRKLLKVNWGAVKYLY